MKIWACCIAICAASAVAVGGIFSTPRIKALKIPNLAPANWKPEPVLVPEGTANVAFGKPVSGSAKPMIGTLDMVTDGGKEGRDGEWLEIESGLQWIQIDLLDKHEIYAVVPWHYRLMCRVYYDVIIQVSNDPQFEKDVHTVFNNDYDNSAGFGVGKDLSFISVDQEPPVAVVKPPVCGRCVRLYSHGNTDNSQNHIIEVEVFGRKQNKALEEPEKLEPLRIVLPKRLFIE